MKQPATTRLRRQAGMASILITMITMMVITLIVLGFATVSRRERGQSLDRQLSTQAFYAAESGIEDAREVIDVALERGQNVPAKPQCDAPGTTPPGGVPYPTSNNGSRLGDGVEYSCLMVDPTPTSLQYNGVDTRSTIIPMRTTGAMSRVVVRWKPSPAPTAGTTTSTSGSTCLTDTTDPGTAGTRAFRPASAWSCKYGVMRMDLVATAPGITMPGTGALPLNRDRLVNTMVSGYFMPTRGNTSAATGFGIVDYATRSRANYTATRVPTGATQPIVMRASCAANYSGCKAEFRNLLPPTAGPWDYTLRLSNMYADKASDVTVQVFDSGGTALPISGAQAVVDATGKAQDVLRRIVARLPVNISRGETPNGPIESSGSVCKRFNITNDFLEIPSGGPGTAFPTGLGDTTNETCRHTYQGTPTPRP